MAYDFNKLRMISRRLVRTEFIQPWQWSVGITPPQITPPKIGINTYGLFESKGGVTDFDLLAKGIDHDPVTIESEPMNAGAITFNFPTRAGSSTINLTMRDSFDDKGNPRFYNFFKNLSALVFNRDGTVNLPNQYLLTLKLFSLTNGEEFESYRCFPQKLGNWSASVDGPGLIEYPATFMQFRSLS